ncbi:MAG: hypothetical protein ACO3C1_08455 [Ilumatobacteraceae bacterium]
MSSPKRSTFWTRTFDEARRLGDWLQVPRLYTRKTAQQIASDIGNAHRRRPEVQRVRGILDGEQWEATWAPVDGSADGDHVVRIRRCPE